jgi:DNA repair protein RecO (recombination protein O)
LSHLSELLVEFTPPHAPDERLFRMVSACLEALSARPAAREELTLYFELWLLKLAGFLPDVRACASCRGPLADTARLGPDGALRCTTCAHGTGLTLSPGTQALLRSALRVPPADWAERAGAGALDARQGLSQLTQQLTARALERAPRRHGNAS